MLIGLEQIKNDLKRMTHPDAYVSLFREIGTLLLDTIKSKTNSGLDYLNRRFSPYSEAYKKLKLKKALYTGRVNLRYTGQMMDSMIKVEAPKEVRITFSNAEAKEKAVYNQEGDTPREFMNASKEIEAQIDGMVIKHIDKMLGM